MSLPVNKKSFNLTNRISKSYSLIISGFEYATSLFTRIRFKLPITFNGKSIIRIIFTFNLRRVRLNFGIPKLITKITQTISARRVRFIFSFKEVGKILTTIYGRIRITAITKTVEKLVSVFTIKKIRLILDPTIAQFFVLGYYDPDTLGDWDAETLGTMDYVET